MIEYTVINEHRLQSYVRYRRWLLPSFLLDAFLKTSLVQKNNKETNKQTIKQNKKTKVEKRIQISG